MTDALPEGWVEDNLGNVCDIARGGSPRPIKSFLTNEPDGINWIKIGDATVSNKYIYRTEEKIKPSGATRSRVVKDGDFILSNSMSFGRPYIMRTTGCIHDGWLVLSSKHTIFYQDYLYHFLSSPEAYSQFDGKASGSTVRNLNIDIVKSVTAKIPPLSEQKRIAEKLDNLFTRSHAAREELTAVPRLIERYKQAILSAAFSGELTRDWREKSNTEPVLKTVKKLDKIQQPRGGREATESIIEGIAGLSVNHPNTEVPQNWAWIKLLDIARQETGHTPSRSVAGYWNKGKIPWIGIKDAGLHHGGVINDTIQHITKAGVENSSARLLPAGTVCLSRTASVGYVVIMGKDMTTSQDFATWTCTKVLDPKFLMYALMAEGEDIKKFGKGTTHTTIYFPEVRAMHIKLAPLEEQLEIIRRIEKAFASIDVIATQTATGLRQISHLEAQCLNKAFRGELVPQNPNDEPASALLERIRTETASAVPAKKARKKTVKKKA